MKNQTISAMPKKTWLTEAFLRCIKSGLAIVFLFGTIPKTSISRRTNPEPLHWAFASGASLSYVNINHFKKSFVFEPGFSYDVAKTRERLYEYKVLLDLKNSRQLPKTIPIPPSDNPAFHPARLGFFPSSVYSF
ncbi:MAG: hypothetical protein IPO07_25410 [Haliscomenobacter sp.]|nr:hypothetical protein [Haliscomenobacter sp.]MBK9491760.1 hypothetical protein [Haliscomenobacter sp.]